MAPRRTIAKTATPGRADVLAEFVVTERQITELRRLPLDEALFRIGHERDVHVAWAKRRADFLANEIRQSRPIGPVVGGTVEFVQPRDHRDLDGIGAQRLG